jgi:hypothetical protein
MFTTAGAVCFTSGTKLSFISISDCGIVSLAKTTDEKQKNIIMKIRIIVFTM